MVASGRQHPYEDEDSHSDGNESSEGRENTGRWTQEEHALFLQGLKAHGKGWKLIAGLIQTRTVTQIRTHAQKYFQKLNKLSGCEDDVALGSAVVMSTATNARKRKQATSDQRIHTRGSGSSPSGRGRAGVEAWEEAALTRDRRQAYQPPGGPTSQARGPKSQVGSMDQHHGTSPTSVADISFQGFPYSVSDSALKRGLQWRERGGSDTSSMSSGARLMLPRAEVDWPEDSGSDSYSDLDSEDGDRREVFSYEAEWDTPDLVGLTDLNCLGLPVDVDAVASPFPGLASPDGLGLAAEAFSPEDDEPMTSKRLCTSLSSEDTFSSDDGSSFLNSCTFSSLRLEDLGARIEAAPQIYQIGDMDRDTFGSGLWSTSDEHLLPGCSIAALC